MGALTTLSFLFATGVLTVVGIRLLWTARRTRQVPELCIGLSMAGTGLGVPGAVLTAGPLGGGPELFSIWAVANFLMVAAMASLFLSTWWIFRRNVRWARIVAAGGVLLALVCFAIRVAGGEIEPLGAVGLPIVLLNVTGVLAYGWAAIESVRYHGMMRRRIVLGLADPVIAHQFLLWGISGFAATANCFLGVLAPVAFQRTTMEVPALFVFMQIVMLIASVAIWFAFFPPAAYRRSIAARFAHESDATA